MRLPLGALALLVPLAALAKEPTKQAAAKKETIVFAVSNSDFGPNMAPFTAADVEQAIPGAGDVTAQFEAVQGRGAAMFQLGGLDAIRRPESWPELLRADWDDGIKGCKAAAAGDAHESARCGSRLSKALWQRFLDTTSADRFVLVSWRYMPAASKFELQASTYRVKDGPALETDRKLVPANDTANAARVLVKAALAGKGRNRVRTPNRELPGVSAH